MLSPPLAIGPQRKTILATAVALHHLAATIVATHRDNSATARCGEDAGRILAASNPASPRRWHRCGSRDQNRVARLVHRDGSRGVRHPTGRCPLAEMLQNEMPPMIETDDRPRRSSLKNQATAKPIAAASKSLGMSTTTPVLTASGVALNEMPAPSLPCCRQSPYARPPSFRAALSFSKVLTCWQMASRLG